MIDSTVAWAYRNRTTQKDARTWALITATYHGPSGAPLDESRRRNEMADDMLWAPTRRPTRLHLGAGLSRPPQRNPQPTGIAELSTQIARSPTTPSSVVAEQLKALRQGISEHLSLPSPCARSGPASSSSSGHDDECFGAI
jgi:hypothetical protein